MVNIYFHREVQKAINFHPNTYQKISALTRGPDRICIKTKVSIDMP